MRLVGPARIVEPNRTLRRMHSMSSTQPDCIRCGTTLELPHPNAQWECPDCGALVAQDTVRHDSAGGW